MRRRRRIRKASGRGGRCEGRGGGESGMRKNKREGELEDGMSWKKKRKER